MAAQELFIVDVFAEQLYTGNQLAVVVGEKFLAADQMQSIAAEMNFSETTFITRQPEADGGFRVRIYTPAREIAFTGHPILGTAWVINQYVMPSMVSELSLNLEVGQVRVSFDAANNGSEVVWFVAPQIELGDKLDAMMIAHSLGLTPGDIDMRLPVQVVAAGTSAIIVPLTSQDALERSMLDLHAFSPLADNGYPPLVYVYTEETRNPDNDLSARFFFEAHGVREDPATGNGAAFLGAYLSHHKTMSDIDRPLRIEQGHQVRRPSLIMLRNTVVKHGVKVEVGGKVIACLKGDLLQ